MKGCEDPPKDAPQLSQCCTGFPEFYSKDIMKNNCSATCGDAKGPSSFCCKSECMLNTFGVLTDGKFDSNKAKAALTNLTADNKAWTSAVSIFFLWKLSRILSFLLPHQLISRIVDGCVAKGKFHDIFNRFFQQIFNILKAPQIVANITAEEAANGGKGPSCTDDQTLNMVIGQCIRREMFFQCPGLSTTPECTALVNFGKKCPMFPFYQGCHDDVNKAAKKGGKKEKKEKSA